MPPSGSNRATCSNDCATAYRKLRFEENHPGGYNNPEVKARREATMEQKYGFKNPSQSPEIKEKKRETCMENYGVPVPAKSPIVFARMTATNQKLYGCDNVFQNELIKEKIYETNMKKYGFKSPSQSPEIKEKKRETCIEKYGVDHPMKNAEISKKLDEFFINKYGVKRPVSLPEYRKKIENSMENIYGYRNNSLKNVKNYENYNDEYILEHFTTDGKITDNNKIEFMKYFNLKGWGSLIRIAKKYNIQVDLVKKSVAERELVDDLRNRYPELTFIENDRKTILNSKTNRFYEIDILVKKGDTIICGIEYNGIYWHDKKKPVKEVTKSNLCAAQGFPLFHIWEDSSEYDLINVFSFLNNLSKL